MKDMITSGFIIKDIIDYEALHNINIIEQMSFCNFDILIDMIKLSLKCDDTEAERIVTESIDKYGFAETFQKVLTELIGREADEDQNGNINKEIHKFSDILMDFYNEFQALDNNLSLTEFWAMTTEYMYKYADGLIQRLVYNSNRHATDSYIDAITMTGVMFGKMKKPLHFKESDFREHDIRNDIEEFKRQRGLIG